MSPQNLLAWAFAGICGFVLVSCCVLQGMVGQMELTQQQQRQQRRGKPSQNNKNKDLSQRSLYESSHPLDVETIEKTVQALRTVPTTLETVDPDSLSYSIHQCPSTIPEGYPVQWKATQVLKHWNPDNTTIPDKIYQGICTLDWRDPLQRELAQVYRQAELPFVLHHHPEIWKTAERWSHDDYLPRLLGDDPYRNEHSQDNHMPYWKLRRRQQGPPGWKPPTENVELSYPEWYSKAKELEQKQTITDVEHFYFRLNGIIGGEGSFLYDELPIFLPNKPTFFMPEPENQRGINCRFGSKGIIAETHFDLSRNFVVILRGQKRYVLAHPNQCQHLELHPPGHPSARHSRIDWSNEQEWQTGKFPLAQVNEVVLQAGDALYLPTAWFHFIVSLNLNYQCNARSGVTFENEQALIDCGFGSG